MSISGRPEADLLRVHCWTCEARNALVSGFGLLTSNGFPHPSFRSWTRELFLPNGFQICERYHLPSQCFQPGNSKANYNKTLVIRSVLVQAGLRGAHPGADARLERGAADHARAAALHPAGAAAARTCDIQGANGSSVLFLLRAK